MGYICHELAETPQGARFEATRRLAYKTGRLVGGDELDYETAQSALHNVVETWDNALQKMKTIDSALAAGEKNPRSRVAKGGN